MDACYGPVILDNSPQAIPGTRSKIATSTNAIYLIMSAIVHSSSRSLARLTSNQGHYESE